MRAEGVHQSIGGRCDTVAAGQTVDGLEGLSFLVLGHSGTLLRTPGL
jgi:hypothetical protein